VKFFNRRLIVLAPIFGLAACASVGRLPKVNLQEPGWTVRQGQAVWHLDHGTREIAGEVMVATGFNGRTFVQFSKSPVPLVIAQSDRDGWDIEFPPEHRHYAGRGEPPKRLIWFHFARVVSGEQAPHNWSWQSEAVQWRLENRATGESLEGYFNP